MLIRAVPQLYPRMVLDWETVKISVTGVQALFTYVCEEAAKPREIDGVWYWDVFSNEE